MALTLELGKEGLRLKSADSATTFPVSPAQAQSWQAILEKRAKEHGYSDAAELMKTVTIAVPTAGDSQYKIAGDFNLDNATAAAMVDGNRQFKDPDLIHAYYEGDRKPDFVLVPKASVEQAQTADATIAGSDAPAGATDEMKKNTAMETIKNPSARPQERKAAITDYLNGHNSSVEDRTKAAINLLDLNNNYGNDVDVRTPKRKEILDVLVEPYPDVATRKAIFDTLLEHDWVSRNNVTDKSMDSLIGNHAKDKYGIECDPVKWNR